MQESSNFNFPLIPTAGFVKYVDTLEKEGKVPIPTAVDLPDPQR